MKWGGELKIGNPITKDTNGSQTEEKKTIQMNCQPKKAKHEQLWNIFKLFERALAHLKKG